MDVEPLNIDQLINSGAHFGHPTRKWNPKFNKYISSNKNGVHIINLNETQRCINEAVKALLKLVQNGKYILFVGTKKQAKDIIQESADKCEMYYIVERWLGGTLTNFGTIKRSIKRLNILEQDSNVIYKNLTKKEVNKLHRERIKLADLHRGIKDMRHLPSALFVVDAKHEKIAVAEAKVLGIPTFGIVDTNTDPEILDFPIPANDDSVKSIKLIIEHIAKSISNATSKSEVEVEVSDSSENTVEDSSKDDSQESVERHKVK